MVDRPILMSGPDVRAILREIEAPGTGKTMMRRPVDVKRYAATLHGYSATGRLHAYCGDHRLGLEFVNDRLGLWSAETNPGGRSAWYVPVRFAVGDRLWVRETWENNVGGYKDVSYRATVEADASWTADEIAAIKWRPSVHMPRWASRLTLVVTEVRVERLQDISEASALAEGADPILVPPDGGSAPHIEGFRALWSNIHGTGAWDANPWVVAIRFVPHLRNINAMTTHPDSDRRE